MSASVPLPAAIPGALTLDQVRETVAAFGYELAMTAKAAPPVPPGFAVGFGTQPTPPCARCSPH